MYKKLWFKIHLILGFTAGIVLLIIGITGAIMSFEKEILYMINKDSHKVEVLNEIKLSKKELLNKFNSMQVNSKIKSITFSKDASSSVIIKVEGEKGREKRKGINYYVNPYTAEILPFVKGHAFFKFIENIHRRLLMGKIGNQIVAVSTLSLFFLMFSGVYIYWKKLKKSFVKGMTFSFKSKGRGFLTSMHSSLGIWVIPMYLVSSTTGLYWSYDWVKRGLHEISSFEDPKKLKKKKNKSTEMKARYQSFSYNEIQNVIDLFNKNVPYYENANLKFYNKKGIYTISYTDKTSGHDKARNNIALNSKTNEVVFHEKFNEQPLNVQLMKSIYALHTGEYFGIFGKILMFLSSLLMVLFTITGVMMYLKRKKK